VAKLADLMTWQLFTPIRQRPTALSRFKYLWIEGVADRVQYAQFLHDGSEIALEAKDWTANHARESFGSKNVLMLELPTLKPNVTVPVIELFLK